jgi:hypothetical protein
MGLINYQSRTWSLESGEFQTNLQADGTTNGVTTCNSATVTKIPTLGPTVNDVTTMAPTPRRVQFVRCSPAAMFNSFFF